jgi:hypothetical protein
VIDALREALLALRQRELEARDALIERGTLQAGYDPQMAEVHRANAEVLRQLMGRWGWPNEALAGADGAESAWLVAQHAIGEPDFMRLARALVEAEAAAGRVPRWQYAYLDDRIRVFEGGTQRYGTQFDMTPQGPVLHAVDDPAQLDSRRRDAGLGPIARRLAEAATEPRPTADEYRRRQLDERAWRQRVGWIDAVGD